MTWTEYAAVHQRERLNGFFLLADFVRGDLGGAYYMRNWERLLVFIATLDQSKPGVMMIRDWLKI